MTTRPAALPELPAYPSVREGVVEVQVDDLGRPAWQFDERAMLFLDVDVPEACSDLLLLWYNDPLTHAYDTRAFPERDLPVQLPSRYRVHWWQASDGGSRTGERHEQVVENTLHSRCHLLPVGGALEDVMFMVEQVGGGGDCATLAFEVRDASAGLGDTWMFYGDSITAVALSHHELGVGTFADMVDDEARQRPVQECGGVSGMETGDAVRLLPGWLELCLAYHCPLAFGTNLDCRRMSSSFVLSC